MSRIRREAPLPIPQIQGHGSLSAYDGDAVTTDGIVTAVQRSERVPGFYLQDPKGDGDVATSDGIFVSGAKLGADVLAAITPGSRVQVSGTVKEDNTLTTLVANQKGLKTISAAGPNGEADMPAAVELQLPKSLGARQTYLESREGMLASLPNALVLAPSSRFAEYYAVDEKTHGMGRDFTADFDPRHLKISGDLGPRPQLVTGDRVGGVHGPITFDFGDYKLQQTRNYSEIKRGPYPPRQWGDLDGDDRVSPSDVARIKSLSGKPASGPLDPADLSGDGRITIKDARLAKQRQQLSTGAPSFTITTMNTKDFFDADDAPAPIDDEVPSPNEYQAKLARVASAIRDKLGLPDVIAMQEVENTHVLDDLVARPELRGLGYKYALLPTNGHRSINPALLYRADHVQVTDVRQVQKQVSMDEAAVAHPDAETGPLFAREPLLVDLTVKNGDAKQDLTVVVNHLISKFSPHGTPTEPLRVAQAKFLNNLVKDLSTAHPDRGVVVLGDMNDTPDSKALKALRGTKVRPVLADPIGAYVPQAERYSFNYQGQSQQIDHILVTPNLMSQVERAGVRHYNADVPENLSWGTGPNRASDHDNPYVSFRLGTQPTADAAQSARLVSKDSAPASAAA